MQTLEELATLTHRQRLRLMVTLGRQSRDDPDARERLSVLSRGGFYERQLALYSCFGSQDGEAVARALHDPSDGIRQLATSMMARLCTSQQIHKNLPTLSPARRRRVLKDLSKSSRRDDVDAYLRQHGPTPDTLALADSAMVQERLPAMLERLNVSDWTRLARMHPHLCVGNFTELLATPRGQGALVRSWVYRLLTQISESQPDLALSLLEAARLAHHPVGRFNLSRLLRRRPRQVVHQLLHSSIPPAPGLLLSVAHRLLPRQRQLLLKAGWLPNPEGWLKHLPLSEREAIWRTYSERWLDPDGYHLPHRLAWLGPQLRREVARAHFDVASLSDKPCQRLAYLAYLPWEEAITEVRPFLNDQSPEIRAAALTSLLKATCFSPRQLGQALDMLRQHKNEADPVRLQWLKAVGELPPKILGEEVSRLEHLLQDALAAADLSSASLAYAEKIVIRLFPTQAPWCAVQLVALFAHDDGLRLYGVDSNFSASHCQLVERKLKPLILQWLSQDRHESITNLASALGPKLGHCRHICKALEAIVMDPQARQPQVALHILASQAGSSLPHLIPALLRQDPSWIAQPAVADYISRRRHDLLTPFVRRKPLLGRFATTNTVHIAPFERGFERWNVSQQRNFSNLLSEVARDSHTSLTTVKSCLRLLSRLPAEPPFHLRTLASVEEKRHAVRTAALRCLARHDDDSVLGTTAPPENPPSRFPSPQTLLERDQQEALLERLLTQPDWSLRRLALQRLCLGFTPSDSLKTPLLACLQSPIREERTLAAEVLIHTYGRPYPQEVGAWVANLTHRLESLTEICDNLLAQAPHGPALEACAQALADFPHLLSLRLPLLAVNPDPTQFFRAVETALAVPGWGWHVVEAVRGAWPYLLRTFSPQELEERWGTREDPRLRFLALDCMLFSSRSVGWSKDMRGLLERYRQDTDPGIRGRAALTFPSQDEVSP